MITLSVIVIVIVSFLISFIFLYYPYFDDYYVSAFSPSNAPTNTKETGDTPAPNLPEISSQDKTGSLLLVPETPSPKLEDELANIENKENQNDFTNSEEEDKSDKSRHISKVNFTPVDPNDINRIWNNKENIRPDAMNLSSNDFLKIWKNDQLITGNKKFYPNTKDGPMSLEEIMRPFS